MNQDIGYSDDIGFDEPIERVVEIVEGCAESWASGGFVTPMTCSGWNPAGDDAWVFKIPNVNKINVEELVSEFCADSYFMDLIKTKKRLPICPVGLYYDGVGSDEEKKNSGLKDISLPVLNGIRKVHKDSAWWNDEEHTRESILNFGCILSTISSMECPTDIHYLNSISPRVQNGPIILKGSIIFNVFIADFETLSKINSFLIDHGYRDGSKMSVMRHITNSDGKITIFERR